MKIAQRQIRTAVAVMVLLIGIEAHAYPIDGYTLTGIRRLLRLELIHSGELQEAKLVPGAQLTVDQIRLNLYGTARVDSLDSLPEVTPQLQKSLSSLFPNLDESYAIAILDMTPGKPLRYAQRQERRGFQPGSVGKLAVIGALFCELDNLYPGDFEKRRELLRKKMVKGGEWALYDEHTVPFFNPETRKLVKRQVQAGDVFSLYEWADHMLSVSNNGAATVVWREAILMRVFGQDYAELDQVRADSFFLATPKSELSSLAVSVVNDPLRDLGITEDEWRLGLMFTRGGSNRIPGKGGSIGSPAGLMKWLIALESGRIVDAESSLEIKRLMYMTDRRIRYAASASLNNAAVYFKSGSLYKCQDEEGYECGKYRGNVFNYMNSVAIIEHPDGTTYLTVLMSNVLRKNSNIDHNALAARIDRLMH